MKYLITGICGFVGGYFVKHLLSKESDAEIYGVDIMPECQLNINYKCLNLFDYPAVEKLIGDIKPDYILHLAAMSSVAASWEKPAETFKNNTGAVINLLEAVRLKSPDTKILAVGSSDVYGNGTKNIPFSEDMPLNPQSPYAVARVSQEMLCRLYAEEYGLNVVMSRSFNHFGPGQSERFAIGSFMGQLVRVKMGKQKTLHTGNIDVSRDFSDVRDVVAAYYLILKQAKKGNVYNICSGHLISLRNIISIAENILGIKPDIVSSKDKMRQSDIDCVYGINDRIKKDLCWQPVFTLEQTLKDSIDWYEKNNGN